MSLLKDNCTKYYFEFDRFIANYFGSNYVRVNDFFFVINICDQKKLFVFSFLIFSVFRCYALKRLNTDMRKQ